MAKYKLIQKNSTSDLYSYLTWHDDKDNAWTREQHNPNALALQCIMLFLHVVALTKKQIVELFVLKKDNIGFLVLIYIYNYVV